MDTPAADRRAAGAVRQYLSGVALLARGLAGYARSPGLMWLGVLPALLAGALYLVALGTLFYFIADLAALATWFAEDWTRTGWRDVVRIVAAVGILGVGALIAVLTFTAVTLLIGDPFYERISERVEQRLGGPPRPADGAPWWRSVRHSAADSLRLVARTALIGVPLFVAGFVPFVGQTVVPVLGASVGGWFLALELTGGPFERRGMRLAERRAALAAHRPLVLGFGTAVFVCLLIPLGAVLVMPAAVVGATLLTRRVLGVPEHPV